MIVDGDYDSTTGKVYALMYSDNLENQVFGTLDYASNTRTIIKQLNENFFTLAASPEGELFAVRHDGALVKFNKANGSYTKVGNTGISPIYMQSAAIDPRTGYPVQHSILSSTVLATDCATADAYATAFMVLGLDSARTVLKHHPELKAYFIYSDNDGNNATWHTDNLEIEE